MNLTISLADGSEPVATTLAEYEANCERYGTAEWFDESEERASIRSLRVGEEYYLGGGATPIFRITRTA